MFKSKEENIDLCLSDYLKVIDKGKSKFIYDSRTGEKLLTNDISLLLLKEIGVKNKINEDIKNIDYYELVRTCKDKRFIIDNNNPVDNYTVKNMYTSEVEKGIHLRNLRLNITEDCNLKCKYCYQHTSSKYSSRRKMSWEVAKKSISAFKNIIVDNGHNSCTIRFFGGEPLLNWTVVEQGVNYANEIFPTNVKINFVINTNGTLLTLPIARFLSDNNITTVISLDGLHEKHDMMRMFKDGRGSFSIIEKKLEFVCKTKCHINIAIVCTDINYPYLIEFINYINKLRHKYDHNINICFSNVHICDQEDIISIDIEQRVTYLIEAIRHAKSLGINCYGGLAYQVYDNMMKPNGGRHCVCLGSEFSVAPDGSITPCEGLDLLIGHIDKYYEVFRNNEYINLINRVSGNLESCKGCEIEAYCAGGCYADYLSSEGKVSKTCRNCRLEVRMFQELVKENLL